ncbi:MAG: biotin-dependent carboxyltransferase family protein, partial [Vibrio sp.]
ERATTFALTGADMNGRLNNTPISTWQSYHAKPGDELVLQGARRGVRAYLSVNDGFNVPNVLHSSSTVMRDELGGLDSHGKALCAQDTLPYSATQCKIRRQVPASFIPDYPSQIELDVMASYQFDWFTQRQHQQFFHSDYTLTPHSDRMGARLSGTPIPCQQQRLISEGIALGSVQIPPDGQPIILMRDRQTIGGYPKLGCLSARSINSLAQCQPGAKITFRLIPLDKAIKQQRQIQQFFYKSGK